MNPTPPQPTDPEPSTADEPAGRGHRAGELYRRVALHLAAHPDTLLKVGEITAAIDAPSSGAVFEALKRMAAAGHATHHRDPHRFQATAAGIASAGTLPPPPPRTPRSATSQGRRGLRPLRPQSWRTDRLAFLFCGLASQRQARQPNRLYRT